MALEKQDRWIAAMVIGVPLFFLLLIVILVVLLRGAGNTAAM
jgi:hypothetical protein